MRAKGERNGKEREGGKIQKQERKKKKKKKEEQRKEVQEGDTGTKAPRF